MTCRYHLLVDAIDGLIGEPPHLGPACDQTAKYRTRITRGDDALDGIDGLISARLCEDHDRQARSDPGYSGSWLLRRQPVVQP